MVSKEDQSNCIFCQIIAGKSPVSLVYQDDDIMVFPDIQPVNPGHLLVIPKIHAPYLADLKEETANAIMQMAIRLSKAIRKSNIHCEGINVFIADGEAAGQDVFHFHLHVIPRFQNDGFGLKYDKTRNFLRRDRASLDSVAGEIKAHL
jgi:histidine triad (HIT) family protein